MAVGGFEEVKVQLQAVVGRFNRAMDAASAKTKRIGKNFRDASSVMQSSQERFKVMNRRMKDMKTSGGRLAYQIRSMTHGFRGFRMEMLGVMFFGMMLQRTFLGLMNPAFELVGLFDLLNTTLGIIFLPTALALMEALLPIMTWFMELPEPTKLVIGQFALLGMAIGTVLMAIGTFALGLGSVILMFSKGGKDAMTFGDAIRKVGSYVKAPFKATVKFVKSGWTALKGSFSTIAKYATSAGKTLISTIRTVMDPSAWKSFLAKKGIIDTIASAKGKILKATITIAVALAAFQVGKQIGKWLEGVLPDEAKVTGRRLLIPGFETIKGAFGEQIASGLTSFHEGTAGFFEDMIWRPGQAPIAVSPQDTIYASKGGEGAGGGFSSGGSYNIDIEINAAHLDVAQIAREIGDNIEREINSRVRT